MTEQSLEPEAVAHHQAVATHIAGGQRNGKSLARMSFRTYSIPWELRPNPFPVTVDEPS